MPTPAERKALLYLGALLCVGTVVRAARSARDEPVPAEARAALARQIDAVDSARRAGKERGQGSRTGNTRGRRRQAVSGGTGTPPPRSQPATADSTVPIDLDTASAALLEALPRVGPALARRIVEDRDRRGPFGSLEGLQRVRGVGPGIARELAGRVTFSGARRLTRAAFAPLGGTRTPVAP